MTSIVRRFEGKHEKLRILALAAAVIVLRSPLLLWRGRVLAEEGTVYLQDAWNLPFWKAFLAPHQGYYSLLDNAAASLAAYVFPLSWAACLFTAIAALVLLLMTYLVISCEAFTTTEARLLAGLFCVISPSIEVWMTMEDAQFCLCVATALILVSDSGRHRVVRCLTLVLAGLTGPVSCALLPFFLIRAAIRRTAGAILQAVLLAACTAVEAWTLFSALHSGERAVIHTNKLAWIGPVFLTKVVALTFGTRLSFFLLLRLLLQHYSTALFVLCWLLALVGLALLVRIVGWGDARPRVLLALALWSFVFAYMGIAESALVVLGGASRYTFVPDLLVWLALVLVWQSLRACDTRRARGMGCLMLFLIASGVLDSAGYWAKEQAIAAPWAPQIAHWKADPATPIQVSPSTWERRIHLAAHRGEGIRGSPAPDRR